LKQIFREGIGRLPKESREGAINGKHKFEWGKIV